MDTERKKAALLTGTRRAGKTYRMFQKIKDLDGEDVFYIDFEDVVSQHKAIMIR
ncbi:MAG: AAA family ATPase [Candidatus Aenigmatarchaeota archaeon]